jgi:hypothetical protein
LSGQSSDPVTVEKFAVTVGVVKKTQKFRKIAQIVRYQRFTARIQYSRIANLVL